MRLLCVGRRVPGWVAEGFESYRKRLPRDCTLTLEELRPAQRSKSNVKACIDDECKRLMARLNVGDRVVLLDERGAAWSTVELARRLESWRGDGRAVVLVVGGADGVNEALVQRADERWSLSPLTLPHALVRVVLAEQIYRAWTLSAGHPYHRP